MNEEEQIKLVIQNLEMFSRRPTMYFSDSLPPVLNFLRGMLWILADHVNINTYYSKYNDVMAEIGWSVTANVPVDQMVSSGLDPEAITKEFLFMELEAWKRVLADLQQ